MVGGTCCPLQPVEILPGLSGIADLRIREGNGSIGGAQHALKGPQLQLCSGREQRIKGHCTAAGIHVGDAGRELGGGAPVREPVEFASGRRIQEVDAPAPLPCHQEHVVRPAREPLAQTHDLGGVRNLSAQLPHQAQGIHFPPGHGQGAHEDHRGVHPEPGVRILPGVRSGFQRRQGGGVLPHKGLVLKFTQADPVGCGGQRLRPTVRDSWLHAKPLPCRLEQRRHPGGVFGEPDHGPRFGLHHAGELLNVKVVQLRL